MNSFLRPHVGFAVLVAIAAVASGCTGMRHATGARAQEALRAASDAERSVLLGGVDSTWFAFEAGSDTLTLLDRLLLDDLASVLVLNPSLELRVWASAPDAPQRQTRMGSETALAGARRGAVLLHLRSRGVDAGQVREQAAEPAFGDLPWRRGGAFLFVAAAPQTLNVPASHARMRILSRPGSEVFFLPRSIVDRNLRIICEPPLSARIDVAGSDSVIVRTYPPRRIVSVARDREGVIYSRGHDVNPDRHPDELDLLRAAPDPQCRP